MRNTTPGQGPDKRIYAREYIILTLTHSITRETIIEKPVKAERVCV